MIRIIFFKALRMMILTTWITTMRKHIFWTLSMKRYQQKKWRINNNIYRNQKDDDWNKHWLSILYYLMDNWGITLMNKCIWSWNLIQNLYTHDLTLYLEFMKQLSGRNCNIWLRLACYDLADRQNGLHLPLLYQRKMDEYDGFRICGL